jgi:hypothetical protein
MPKKTASARGGASRNKPKAQKSVQLVHPKAAVSENETKQDESSIEEEETTLAAPTAKAAAASTATVSKTETVTGKKSGGETVTANKSDRESVTSQKAVEETAAATGKGSASARLAARRQGQGQTALKPSTTRPSTLVTAEHYAYVRRDLIYILILAIIMFSAIIILHFVPAIGG